MEAIKEPDMAHAIKQLAPFFKQMIREVISETSEPKPQFYSRDEACKIIKISLPTLSRYIDLGILKAHKVGNRILISQEDMAIALKEIKHS